VEAAAKNRILEFCFDRKQLVATSLPLDRQDVI
jgi:hypothetical protein